MTTIYSKAGADAAIGAALDALTPEDVGADPAGTAAEAVAALDLGTAAVADAADFAPASSAAYPVQQVTLTGSLAYALPVDAPADQVISVVFTQDGTGGHTVTYGGAPVTVDTTAGASTTVELHPVGAGYVVRYPAADVPTAAGRALLIGADSAAQRTSLGLGSAATTSTDYYHLRAADRRRRAREHSARWTLAGDGLSTITSTGIAMSGDAIAASVAGVDGDAIFPVWGALGFRASFHVVATKSVAGSVSGVGFTATTLPASLPGTTGIAWVIGYVQGYGIAVKPYNVSGGVVSVIPIPDASITDGDEFDITIWMNPTIKSASGDTNATSIRIVKPDGTEVRTSLTTYYTFLPTNVLIRTNTGTPGALSAVQISTHPAGTIGGSTASGGMRYMPGVPAEILAMRVPAVSNGKLVFALHGHGSSGEVIMRTSYLMPSWTALTDAGFTVAFPDLAGNAWANDTAMSYLAVAHQKVTEALGLDPDVYLYGISMGGGTSLTAIAKRIIPVRAAYLAHPSCDMRSRWADPATWPTLQAAYAGVEADMLDNNPMSQPPSLFAGVPMLFTASPGDTTTPKAEHTDAFRALLGSVTPSYLITVTGDHMDPSHFRAQDTLNFFRANL